MSVKLQSNHVLCLTARILVENSCYDSTSGPNSCSKHHVEKLWPAYMVVSSVLVAHLRLYLLAVVTCVSAVGCVMCVCVCGGGR